MEWRWTKFASLSPLELNEIFGLRQRVFIVEQNCAYLDCDGLDPQAWHFAGLRDSRIVAYMRVFPPGVKYPEVSLGRVVTSTEVRGTGMGKELMLQGLSRVRQELGAVAIRISAQAYLKKFYGDFGFIVQSEPYLEDGIPHVEMLLT